jgi:exodeoxyribonuclease V alpha subunit
MPAGEVAILRYLSSGSVKGIGPVTAKRIVERFKDQTFEILSSHPEMLSEVQGITSSKAKSICESFSRQLGIRRLMEYLIRFSVRLMSPSECTNGTGHGDGLSAR